MKLDLEWAVTPDGQRYLAMARGQRQPIPFHLRWLLPWLLGEKPWGWLLVTYCSLGAIAIATAALGAQRGLSDERAIVAGVLVLGLPSMRFLAYAPVLVDACALMLALFSALLLHAPPLAEIDSPGWVWSIALALLAGAVSEKAPVWAALFAWSPIPLIGLTAPLLRWLFVPAQPAHPEADWMIVDPIAAGVRAHRRRWRDPALMVLPWGACVFALGAPSAWLGAALALGYAQLLLATDSVRLYQSASPVVSIAAASALPIEWALPILVAHWFNPWAGNGV